MKSNLNGLLATASILLLFFTACDAQLVMPQFSSFEEVARSGSTVNDSTGRSLSLVDPDDHTKLVPELSVVLYTGKDLIAGDVLVQLDDDSVVIIYQTTDDWKLTELHLWLGTSINEMPQNRRGMPKVGKFPYKAELNEPKNRYELRIPFASVDDQFVGVDLYCAAHAVVEKTNISESAWAAGTRFTDRGSWATYFSFKLTHLTYEVGDIGPAGGHIFYIDEADEFEWTYLEAAPEETEWSEKPWGGQFTEVSEATLNKTIGAGEINTAAIVSTFGDAEPYEGRTDYAAKLASDLIVVNNNETFDDWFLPSNNEASLMYQNLYTQGLGGFTSDAGYLADWYWTSTEYNAREAFFQRFNYDHCYPNAKSGKLKVRAIRSF